MIIKQANDEYHTQCRQYDDFYHIATTPIHLKFDHNRGKINAWANRQLKKIHEQENHQISYFARDVQGIAQAYLTASQYNRDQEQIGKSGRLYPDLGLESFGNLYEAYQPASYFGSKVNPYEINRFYQQIYQQQPQPSAPPYEQQF
jgi:hypothetical protein